MTESQFRIFDTDKQEDVGIINVSNEMEHPKKNDHVFINETLYSVSSRVYYDRSVYLYVREVNRNIDEVEIS